MPAMPRWFVFLVAGFGLSSSVALAEPAVPPFYQAVMNVKPDGKLGEVIRKEAVERQSRVRRRGGLPTSPPTSTTSGPFRQV